MFTKLIVLLLLPFISIGVHKFYLLEVNPADFSCQHRKQIKGDPARFFQFLATPLALEKLFPWLTRFKEADKRIISIGKSYKAVIRIPILGERQVYARLTDYKPPRVFTLDFSDNLLKQKIVIQTRSYHDRTLLQTTIYCQRTSLIYQYTIGYALGIYLKNQLKMSMTNVAEVFEALDRVYNIADFSKKL